MSNNYSGLSISVIFYLENLKTAKSKNPCLQKVLWEKENARSAERQFTTATLAIAFIVGIKKELRQTDLSRSRRNSLLNGKNGMPNNADYNNYNKVFIRGIFLLLMQKEIAIIKNEHNEIRQLLSEIDSMIGEENLDVGKLSNCLHDLGIVWNSHELREESLFEAVKENGPFPEETMLVEQHREFKGHWQILQDAVSSDDIEEIKVALDTDGRMLTGKLKEHIAFEDEFFDSLEAV